MRLDRTTNALALSKQAFAISVVAYCFLSHLLFMLTSGGWSLLFYRVIGGGFFLALAFTLLVFVSFTRRREITIDAFYFVFLILVQLVMLMLNFGDCSDAGGSYVFLDNFIQPNKPLCSEESILASYMMLIIPIAYPIFLITFLLKIIRKSG